MKIGNTSINVEALSSITKEDFLETYRGKILNIESEVNKLNKYFKKEEVVQDYVQENVQESVQDSTPRRKRKKKNVREV